MNQHRAGRVSEDDEALVDLDVIRDELEDDYPESPSRNLSVIASRRLLLSTRMKASVGSNFGGEFTVSILPSLLI